MAAPPTKCIKDLTGKWTLSKTLSDPFDPVFALQGVPWLKRKAMGLATLHLDISQTTLLSEKSIVQLNIDLHISPGNMKNKDSLTLDGQDAEKDDPTFGAMKGKARYVGAGEEEFRGLDEYLREGWVYGGEGEGEEHILTRVGSVKNGWCSDGVWGFMEIEGGRYYCRKLVTRKGDTTLKVRMVYDFVGEL